MDKLFKDYRFKALVSGFCSLYACLHISYYAGWICFIPLFFVLQSSSPKISFRTGFIFGLAVAIPSFFWMMLGAHRFTGTESIYGFLVFFLSSVFIGLYFGLIGYGFSTLKQGVNNRYNLFINAILCSSLFVFSEFLLNGIAKYLPWFGFHSGNPLMDGFYSIQLASLFGIHGLSFFIILINFLFAHFLQKKEWVKLLIPGFLVILFIGVGYFLNFKFISHPESSKPVSVALLNGNIAPEVKWNNENGHLLVENLLNLSRDASDLNPDIALWTESAIPWTYQSDDDMVKEILKTGSHRNIINLLGINSPFNDSVVYNSLYALNPDGKIAGIYNKRILLSFIEQPFAGLIFPFLSSDGFYVKPGNNDLPISLSKGKAGIMICNESTVPEAAYGMTNNGAQFLFNISNDGWFADTYIVNLHFYNVRMRAIENRKDICVNSNLGYSGLVNASGEILLKHKSNEPFVKSAIIVPNTFVSFYSKFPSLFIFICFGVIVSMIFKKYLF